jgi:hypothetical protein
MPRLVAIERLEQDIGAHDGDQKPQASDGVPTDTSQERFFEPNSPLFVSKLPTEHFIESLLERQRALQVSFVTTEVFFVSLEVFIQPNKHCLGSTDGLPVSTEGFVSSTDRLLVSTDDVVATADGFPVPAEGSFGSTDPAMCRTNRVSCSSDRDCVGRRAPCAAARWPRRGRAARRRRGDPRLHGSTRLAARCVPRGARASPPP